jgi:hypothetical protein
MKHKILSLPLLTRGPKNNTKEEIWKKNVSEKEFAVKKNENHQQWRSQSQTRKGIVFT